MLLYNGSKSLENIFKFMFVMPSVIYFWHLDDVVKANTSNCFEIAKTKSEIEKFENSKEILERTLETKKALFCPKDFIFFFLIKMKF